MTTVCNLSPWRLKQRLVTPRNPSLNLVPPVWDAIVYRVHRTKLEGQACQVWIEIDALERSGLESCLSQEMWTVLRWFWKTMNMKPPRLVLTFSWILLKLNPAQNNTEHVQLCLTEHSYVCSKLDRQIW